MEHPSWACHPAGRRQLTIPQLAIIPFIRQAQSPVLPRYVLSLKVVCSLLRVGVLCRGQPVPLACLLGVVCSSRRGLPDAALRLESDRPRLCGHKMSLTVWCRCSAPAPPAHSGVPPTTCLFGFHRIRPLRGLRHLRLRKAQERVFGLIHPRCGVLGSGFCVAELNGAERPRRGEDAPALAGGDCLSEQAQQWA